MQFVALFQIIISLMAFAQKMKGATGEQKKALVMEGVQSAIPLIVPMLPAGAAQGVLEAEKVLTIASEVIDSTHAVLKANNLYPHVEEALAQVGSAVAVTNAALQGALSQGD